MTTSDDFATSGDHAASGDHATSSNHATRDDPPPSRRFRILFTAAMIVIAIGWSWVWHARTDRIVVGAPPVLAVAGVVLDTMMADHEERAVTDDVSGDDVAGVVGDMLSVAIRRIGVPVVETGQLYALTGGMTTGAALVEAARERGVSQVVQSELRVLADGTYELESRRVDAQTRDLVSMLRTRGATLIEVVDRMAAQVAINLGLRVPDGSVADAMTGSLEAWTAYEAGLRALHARDTTAAMLRLEHALAADTTFHTARQLYDHIGR